MEHPNNIDNIRHSLAHLLAAAVLKKHPKTKLGVGPTIENGFYYDFLLSENLSTEDLPKLEKEMRGLMHRKLGFQGEKLTPAKAKATFKDQPFKLELIKEFSKEKKQLTLYRTGDVFMDLCKGGHVENTSEINADAFKLTHVAGAYWRGDEKNPQMQRVYGVAFETKEELEKYLLQQEEAKKRDHRKLGKELDLFVFSDLVGSGMPMFTPKGNHVRNGIINFSRELNAGLGFEEVHTPNINKAELFKISGHYDKYKEDMLTVRSQYSTEDFFMKPMNCPQHTQIYASRPRSYRDLPIRYSDFAVLYRDERPGELSGLTRLRSFAQDDGHIFCREDQIEQEISNILEAIQKALKTYRIDYWMRLSLRDPKKKEKYLGDDAVWKQSQEIMRKLLIHKKIQHKEAEGEAAFYGPKIDIMAVDALGRVWQISTIQLDFNQPGRFKLAYTDKDGSEKTPVMIHRALVGSPDRFMGILIEHYGGAFPLWLAPVQIAIIPISENQKEYAWSVKNALSTENVRVEVYDSNDTLGKRIREAETQKIPYTVIVGEKEAGSKTVSIRGRGNKNLGEMEIAQFVLQLRNEIEKRL
ncbi:MAG: threonine--tRNA ligase [Candidatus Colwellbacteria bacterium RIFCSPLOWO2_01_FULL_48_10]|uniref:Threonine--tRNA ligase n=1 Tax=Candidatus Colwellbacteria bacterium RIFCSPLOWO2_01_FULL_48_10 TaxID=1797690 RepID=A0A1G1Z4U7_9BACT|nr:MAG: threonine--tRNA ligase [Candidatus Colwellbacteria bacterium RIFCSPLOWO2_01_FULL_48_10]